MSEELETTSLGDKNDQKSLNNSIYGDDDSLLPTSTVGDVVSLTDNHSEENKSLSSIQIIYSNEQESNLSAPDTSVYEEYTVACQQGDVKKVRELIESKAIDYKDDVNPVLDDNISGLHWACINNRLTVVKYLVSLPDYAINRVTNDVSKTTPLHWAVKYGHLYIFKELVQKGADINAVDSQGYNILQLATLSSNIMNIIYILTFYGDKIDVNYQNNDGRTALMLACYQGDALTVSTLLKLADTENQLQLGYKDNDGFNCLNWAIVKGNTEVLSLIIKKLNSSIKSHLYESVLKDGAQKDCFVMAKEMNTEKNLKTALQKNGYMYDGDTIFSTTFIGKFFELNHPPKDIAFKFQIMYLLLPFLHMGLIAKLGDYCNVFIHAIFIQPLLMGIFGLLYVHVVIPLTIPNCGATWQSRVRKAAYSSYLLSGVLWSTILWGIYFHITRILYFTIVDLGFFYFLRSVVFIYFLLPFLLYRLMFKIDPGYINEDKPEDRLENLKKDINMLMEKNQFNLRHFDLDSLKPVVLRSRFLHRNQKVVNKLDHFCIWIFNDVGLNNHKFFIYFVIVLLYSISLILEGSYEYFDYLEDAYKFKNCFLLGDDKLCAAYRKDSFMLYSVSFMAFQGIWVFWLLLTQLFVITKGFTGNEFEIMRKSFMKNYKNYESSRDNKFSEIVEEIESLPDTDYSMTRFEYGQFESSPRDFYRRSEIYKKDKNFQVDKLLNRNRIIFFEKIQLFRKKVLSKNKVLSDFLIKTLLIEVVQYLSIVYYSYNGNVTCLSPFDYGVVQNLKDFFLNTDTRAPIWERLIFQNLKTSEGLINNRVVDYSTMLENHIEDPQSDTRFALKSNGQELLEEALV